MNRRILVALLALLAGLVVPPLLAADPPGVLVTLPPDGSEGVPADLAGLILVFDRPMDTGSHSLVRSARGAFPALGGEGEWRNERTFLLPVKDLVPGRTYAVGLNDERHGGFRAADGTPLPPTSLAFAAGPAGAEGRPVVVGSLPNPGATGVDPGTDRVVFRFSEPVRAGRMSLVRVAGTEPLGFRRDRPPFLEDERTLVVPVTLAGGTRYGVSVNGPGHEGFVSAATGRPVLAFPLVFDTAPGGTAPAAEEGGLAGTWRYGEGGDEIRLELGRDGRYRYRGRFDGEAEEAAGTWVVEEGFLVVNEDGAAEPLRVPFRRVGADALDLTIEGRTFRLVRERGTAPRDEAGRGERGDRETAVRRELPPSGPGGTILFTRYEGQAVELGGQKLEMSLGKLWCMRADGSRARKLWDVADDVIVQDPWWAPDGQAWLCASDSRRWESALFMDVWYAPRDSDGIRRVTGNSESPPAAAGRGRIALHLVDDTGKDVKRINWSWQGNRGTVKELAGEGRSLVEDVPAGKIWIRSWTTKHIGDLQVVDVPAGGTVAVKLRCSRGNRLATWPSITPDGKVVVCLSQHAYYDALKEPPEQGFDTMAAVDAASGQLLALWDPTKNGGAFARDPRLSPDGRWIAFAMGLPGMESLAVCSLESFLAGKPDPRVLVPGERRLGQGTFGNVSPAWSLDGRRIVFARYFLSTRISGDLFVVGAEGGTPAQLTHLAPNQCPTYPSWSPAGTHVAFQLVTSRGPALDVLDLIRLNVTSDVCTVAADGTGLRRITSDGRSGQPAWGP